MATINTNSSGNPGNLTAAIRAPFSVRNPGVGIVSNTANATHVPNGWQRDNTFEDRYQNAAGTDVVRAISVDNTDKLMLAEEAYIPIYQTVKFNLSTAAQLVTQHFFIVPTASRIVGITEIHATAESTAATMTAYIEKLTGTTAPGSGTTVMSGTFNMKSTANTLQTGTLSQPTTGNTDDPLNQFAAGDRVGIKFSTAGTELAGVAITITFAINRGTQWVVYNLATNSVLADQSFYVANRAFIVTNAFWVHSTKCSVASTVVQLTKDTSTNAPGAGTDLLTNNTNTGFDLTGVANTVQTGTLTATAASLRLAPGDRLSVDYAGTLTALAGCVMVVVLQSVERYRTVTWTLNLVTNMVDSVVFLADRGYELVFATAVWGTAFTTALNVQLTHDIATDAPGAGTDLLSNDTNTGFQIDGSANVPETAIWKDTRYNFLMAGDRVSVDFNGTPASGTSLTITLSLKPA